jgi:Dihydrouridine synthase (Dus)
MPTCPRCALKRITVAARPWLALVRGRTYSVVQHRSLQGRSPVALAPMAGITNVAFRQLCREFGSPTSLYVCEMITARAIVERDPKTMEMITFGPDEHPRSMQLYGVDPATMAEAAKIVVGEGLTDHLDTTGVSVVNTATTEQIDPDQVKCLCPP